MKSGTSLILSNMEQEPRWNISEIALSWHFWKPIFTILSVGASVWSLFYYVPFHTILWTLAVIACVIFLVVVGLINYETHADDIRNNRK